MSESPPHGQQPGPGRHHPIRMKSRLTRSGRCRRRGVGLACEPPDRPKRVLMSVETEVVASWKAGEARRAVLEVRAANGVRGRTRRERIAVFDNDGTLWCEKPMPIQADFTLRRLSEMAQADPGCVIASPGRRPMSATTAGAAACSQSTMQAMTPNCRASWPLSWPLTRGSASMSSKPSQTRSALSGASDPWPEQSRVRVCADDRVTRLPGGERVLELHRLGWG
jgi:hypothetical protein